MEKKEELFIPKTKNKGLKITIGIVLLLALAVGAYFLFQYKFNNSKNIVVNFLDQAEENINYSFKEVNDAYKGNGHLKINTNIKEDGLDLLNDLELLFDGEVDTEQKIWNLNISTKYKNDKLVDVKTYQENNVYYFLLDGVYDKYIKTEVKEEDKVIDTQRLNVNQKSIKTVLQSIVNSLKKEINNQKFNKQEEKITIDGKSIDVINNYIILKDKEVNAFAKNLANYLKDDQKFVAAYKDLTGVDAKEYLEKMIQGINEEEFKGSYKISFYTDKGLLNKNIISVRQEITQDGDTTHINVDRISDDEVLISTNLSRSDLSIRIKKNNSTMNITLGIKVEEQYLNIELTSNYEKIKTVTKPDVSNSKNMADITEKEMNDIQNKLMENENIKKLLEAVNKIDKEA